MCPVISSVAPTIPHLDDTLLLQFNPDLLIMADKFMPFVWIPESGKVGGSTVNPGSFGVNSNRAMVYFPRTGKLEMIDIVEQQ